MHQTPTYLYLHLSKQLLKLWDKYVTQLHAWSIPRAVRIQFARNVLCPCHEVKLQLRWVLDAMLVERFTAAQKQPFARVKYKG
jgi:hypothetical protein